MLSCRHCEILTKYIFELCFVSEVLWDMPVSRGDHVMRVTPVLAALLARSVHWPMNMVSQWVQRCMGLSGDERQVPGALRAYVFDGASRDADGSERPSFPFEPELASNAERRQWCLRNMNDQKTYYIFSFMLLSSISQLLCPKW